jgi:hypothetical protein
MTFENTIHNLKLEKDNSIAQECLNVMRNGEVLFNSGFEQEKEQLTSLYSFRLNMAKDLNKDKYKADEISNWELAIKNLKTCSAKKLELNWVSSEFKHFMLFWNCESEQLAGIFYLYPKRSIKEQEKHNSEIIEKGFSVSSIKYDCGRIIKEWK